MKFSYSFANFYAISYFREGNRRNGIYTIICFVHCKLRRVLYFGFFIYFYILYGFLQALNLAQMHKNPHSNHNVTNISSLALKLLKYHRTNLWSIDSKYISSLWIKQSIIQFFICFDYDERPWVKLSIKLCYFRRHSCTACIYRSSLIIYSHHGLGDSDDNHADYQSAAGTTISCLREQ